MIKTLVIRNGRKHTIRAIAWPGTEGERDICPTLKFFEEQKDRDAKELALLGALLSSTADDGPPATETRFKHLAGTKGLYEFKTAGGLRLICFWDDHSLIICTHGYLKGRQKTPVSELKRANDLKKRYEQSKKEGDLEHA